MDHHTDPLYGQLSIGTDKQFFFDNLPNLSQLFTCTRYVKTTEKQDDLYLISSYFVKKTTINTHSPYFLKRGQPKKYQFYSRSKKMDTFYIFEWFEKYYIPHISWLFLKVEWSSIYIS